MKLAYALAAATALAVFAACGDTEEAALVQSPAVGGSPTTATNQSTAATGTAKSTEAPWLEYSDASLGFAFKYPAGWTVEQQLGDPKVRVASFELLNWDGEFPIGGVLIDVGRVDQSQVSMKPENATDATVGGEPAWVLEKGRPTDGDARWKHGRTLLTSHDGYGYIISGAFGDESPDQPIFQQVLDSFRFTN